MQFPKVLKHVLDRQLKSGMHRLWLHASTSTMAQLTGLFTHFHLQQSDRAPVLWSISHPAVHMQFSCKDVCVRGPCRNTAKGAQDSSLPNFGSGELVLESVTIFSGYSGTNPRSSNSVTGT